MSRLAHPSDDGQGLVPAVGAHRESLGHLLGLSGVEGAVAADMEGWCRDDIGLDGNGFVGNYLRHCGVLLPGVEALREACARPTGRCFIWSGRPKGE